MQIFGKNFATLVLTGTMLYSCSPDSDRTSNSAKSNGTTDCLAIRSGTLIDSDSDDEKKYQAAGRIVFNTPDGGALCSGTLIHPNIVLTAEHCIGSRAKDADTGGLLDIYQSSTFGFKLNNADKTKGINQLIGWSDPIHRDTALLVLTDPYDETFPYLRIKKGDLDGKLAPNENLQQVGWGAYTEGADTSTFAAGQKRQGTAEYFAHSSDNHFGPNVNYIHTKPGGDSDEQIICSGDSGSGLLRDFGEETYIIGVTSLGASVDSSTSELTCATAVDGLSVPSDRVNTWVETQVATIEPQYTSNQQTDFYVSGTISSIDVKSDYSNLTLAAGGYTEHDAISPLPNREFRICNTGCDRPTVTMGSLTVGREISIRGVRTDDISTAKLAAASNLSRITKSIEVSGTINSVKTKTIFGRAETHFILTDLVVPEESSNTLPKKENDEVDIISCASGCSKATKLNKLELVDGEKVTINGDYILHQGFYARSVQAYTPQVAIVDPCEIPEDL